MAFMTGTTNRDWWEGFFDMINRHQGFANVGWLFYFGSSSLRGCVCMYLSVDFRIEDGWGYAIDRLNRQAFQKEALRIRAASGRN